MLRWLASLFRPSRSDSDDGLGAPRHFDLRSDAFKAMQDEVASGAGPPDPAFGALVDELTEIVQAAYAWGGDNGFPKVDQYPHYGELRRLGEAIFNAAGFEGMQRAHEMVRARCGGAVAALLDFGWINIGGWRP